MAASTRLNHRALPMTAWPRSDQEAWAAAIRHPDFLVEGGRGATWRPESGKSARGTYGRWLAWLMAQGVDLETEAPAERLTIDRLRAYVAFLQDGRSSVTVASYTGVLCMAVLAMFPDRNWTKCQRVYHGHLYHSKREENATEKGAHRPISPRIYKRCRVCDRKEKH